MADLTTYVCRWDAVDSRKEWRRRPGIEVAVGSLTSGGGTDPNPDPVYPQLFAGHVPNRVLIGMATPSSGTSKPLWDEARTILAQPIYEARRFVSGWITQSSFNSMVGDCDAATAYNLSQFGVTAEVLPNISFKVPGGSNATGWAEVRDGLYDADLVNLAGYITTRNKPLVCSFEHEPTGTGITDADLTTWGQMHTRLAYFFGGYRSCTVSSAGVVTLGTYNAAHDLTLNGTGLLAWGPIGNGFPWRTSATDPLSQGPAMFPQYHIDALRLMKGIAQVDTYDVDYADQTGALTDPTLRVAGSGVRTSVRNDNFIAWMRARNCGALGFGEYGVIDGPEMTATWVVLRNNRDLVGLANYFNSMQNSDHDWRVVPSTYPQTDPQYQSSKGLVDYGGDANSQARLDAYRTTLTESTSATYTGPVG